MAAIIPKTAKIHAIHFHPKAFSIYCMGPPDISPRLSCSRYFTASKDSAYFVAILKNAVIHIQKIAPKPPVVIAVATPTIVPVPIAPAKEVIKA
ncbi:hypothetical protein PRO82_000860 [Candidatus Protochlamydia amoebophila]|nr:hypothetical protein [Candidatus Protochlamydia amoebophila]